MDNDSERTPFEKGDHRLKWQVLYDELLAEADFGALITYEQLDAVLGRPFVSSRSPLYRAREHLGAMRRRWLAAVPGKGYRVIEPQEHVRVAEDYKDRARGQLAMMVKVGEVTDVARLTPAERTAFDIQMRINATLYSIMVHHEQRLDRIEGILHQEGLL